MTTAARAKGEGALAIDRQLYDAKSREFVNPDGWLRQRKRPHERVPSLRVRVSPDETFAIINGSLISLQTGKYSWGRGDVIECGFLD